jgi:hypothetical protein
MLSNLHPACFKTAVSPLLRDRNGNPYGVLDLSTGSAAALATMFLGDHGARVVRLIAPGSSHLRQGGFIVWDRGKACATLDLNQALDGLASSGTHQVQDGRPAAEFLRLVAGADVLLEAVIPLRRAGIVTPPTRPQPRGRLRWHRDDISADRRRLY